MPDKAARAVFLPAVLLAVSVAARPQSLREAARLDAEGKCAEAEQIYNSALAKGSPSSALLNNTGNHYLACGQPDKAKLFFEKLVRIKPDHTNANLQLARIATEEKQGTKALVYLDRVRESDPGVLLLRAEALHWAGKPAESVKLLDAVGQEAKGDLRLLYLLGLTCGRLALFDRAENTFSDALALRPGDPDLLVNLGRAAARAQHYERAQRALETALKIHPGDAGVLLELGRVCAARQDYVRAVFLLAQARQKEPENTEVLLMLARAAQDAGYYDDSAKAYDEYLRLRPDDDAVRRDRAVSYGYTESRTEEARKELDWYLRKHPKDPLGHYAFAQVFWWPEPQQALAHLTEAARLDPDSFPIRFSRGWMLQRLGQMAESLPDLEAARKLAPENARVLDLIGLARLALDQPAEAEKILRMALEKTPNDPETVLHMGRALMALGREKEAQAFLEKYQKIRPPGLPGLRKRFGMIELATLPASEQRQKGIEHFQREAHDHPDRPDYQLHLATLLLADGQQEESLRQFRLLLTLNANRQVWEEAGSLLLNTGEYELARRFLERAATESPSARLELAAALFHLQGAEAALQFLEKIPAKDLTGDGWLLKASLLDAAGRRPEAEKALDAGLGRASTRPQMVQRTILLLLRLNRGNDGLDLLDRAIQANPQDPDLPLTKAVVLSLMDRSSEAEKLVKEVELRWPEWDRAYLAHGLLLEQFAKGGDARQKLQTAAALGSKDSRLQCALARLTGAANPGPECPCSAGLKQLLYPDCAQEAR